jgi:hypothetical protein
MRRSSDLDWSKAVGLFCIGLWLMLLYGVANGAEPPPCWPDLNALTTKPPKLAVTQLPKGFRDKWVGNWICVVPNGYRNVSMVFNDADATQWVPSVLAGTFSKEAADAKYRQTADVIFEDNLVAAKRKISLKYKMTVSVSSNGDSLTRPVKFVKPDGTLVDLPSKLFRVGVGEPCWPGGRVPGTNYYSVYGRPNVATPYDKDVFGTQIVAVCKPYFPLSPSGG